MKFKRPLFVVLFLSVLAIGCSWYAVRWMETHLVRVHATSHAMNWATHLRNRVVDLEAKLQSGRFSTGDRQALDLAIDANELVGFLFYNSSGEVLLASRPENRSKSSETLFTGQLAQGQSYTFVEPGDPPMLGGAIIPVFQQEAFVGAIEIHTNVAAYAEELGTFGRFARFFFTGIFLLAAALAGILITMEWRVQAAASAALRKAKEAAERAEFQLRGSQQSLAQAQEVAKVANWRWSFDTASLTSWSEEFPRIFGIEKEDVDAIGNGQVKIIHPDDQAGVLEVYDAVSPENAGYDIQYRILRRDGELRYLREVAEPERNSDGAVTAQFGVVQDITEQRLTEDALRASETRYRALYTNTPVMMHSIDSEGRLISVSDHWCRVMGYQADEVLGRKVTDLMAPESRDYASGVTLPAFMKTGAVKDAELQFVKKNGETVDVLLSAISEVDEQGDYVRSLAVLTDVTERNLAEAKLRRSQRLETVGHLTGGVAHDFNNLLTGISLAVDLLDEKTPGEGKNSKHLDLIRKSINRGQTMTRRLLAFSRKQTLSPLPSDVNALISGLEDELKRTLGGKSSLRIERADNAWPAMIDPRELENALLSLAANAGEAMPEGGTLTITTRNLAIDKRAARKREDLAPGDYLEIVVEDTGAGMSKEVREHAFEPFFTTQAFGESSGLGLSTVYGFVKQSSGDAFIESEPGKGTRVSLFLPRATALPMDHDPEDKDTPLARGSERILVVEDDPDVRLATVGVLRSSGYRVVEARNGDEAMIALKADPSFDLLFTDVVLPGTLNGTELADQAERLNPEIKVLCTTGYESLRAHLEAGLEERGPPIKKPYRRDELIGRVRALLENGE